MRSRDGGEGRQRVCTGDAPKANGAFGKSCPPSSRISNLPQGHFAVTDGRVACGTIDLIDYLFVAIDGRGATIGRFHTLRAAMRAFDDGGER